MCYEMEKIYSEGMESGEKCGELKKAKEIALSMAEEGMDVKMIARLVKVNEKEVQKSTNSATFAYHQFLKRIATTEAHSSGFQLFVNS